MTQQTYPMIHLRFNGRSQEIPLTQLDGVQHSNDAALKQAVARYLDLPSDSLSSYVIVRTTQAIIIRPEALYG